MGKYKRSQTARCQGSCHRYSQEHTKSNHPPPGLYKCSALIFYISLAHGLNELRITHQRDQTKAEGDEGEPDSRTKDTDGYSRR